MKTYYDILEVSRFASDDVINKAHKILVKKYHPDLQTENDKKQAEEQMILINQAYEVLSDPVKKKQYDETLEQNERKKTYSATSSASSTNSSSSVNNDNVQDVKPWYHNIERDEEILEQNRIISESVINAQREIYNKQIEIMNKMEDQYYDRLRAMGYTIKEPFSLRDFVTKCIIIFTILLIIYLIFKIPFTYNYLLDLAADNYVLESVFRFIKRIIGG